MTVQRRDALPGASLLSAARAGRRPCGRRVGGAARASRTKSEISCIQGMFVRFGLDPSSLSLRRIKAQALRGNAKTFPSCRVLFESKPSLLPNNPRLEARLHKDATSLAIDPGAEPWRWHRPHLAFLLSYCPATVLSAYDTVSRLCAFPCRVAGSAKASQRSGLTFAQFGFGLFRSRNAKWLAVVVILRFIPGMVVADKTDSSKLSASLTRPCRKRAYAPSCIGQLGKGGGPPLHPPCRFARHAETVPVSAPFGLCSVDAPSWVREVRP